MLKISKINLKSIVFSSLKLAMVYASIMAIISFWKVMIRLISILGVAGASFKILSVLACITFTMLIIMINIKNFIKTDGE